MAVWRPTWQNIITEHSVQTWQDWPWDTWLGPYVVISPRRYRVRVRVYRAGEWVDITSRVASGVIRESNDQPVATLELRLLNGRQYPSLAPRRKDSPLNRVNGQYVPLLWIGRLIAVEAAFSEDGSEPDEWWPVFLGELEDEIDTESTERGTYVRLFCRDMAARLQRAYIAGPKTYENMYASQMIQAILDDAYSEGLIQEPVTVRLVGADDFWVERYDVEYTDLWSALQRFCQQRGTDLRHRLNEATGQIELTYWLPDRAMVPGWIIDASQIRREDLRISGTDIINRVTVRYRDAQTGQRAEVTVQDEDSIAMYGLRHGLIEEPDTDLIPDQETAQKLAQTVVDDLKDVPALTRLTVPFDPRIQLFDKLRVANPSVRDEPEDYAIEGRELQFSATDWSMVLIGGGRVVVKRHTWLERMATEGVKRPFTPRDTTTSVIPPAPTIIEARSVPGGVQLTLAPPLGLYWNGFVIHASTTPNFTPSGATEVAWGSETRFSILGLQPGTTYYFKAQALDFARNRSLPSNEVSARAGSLTPDGFTAVVGNALVTTDGTQDRVAVGDVSGKPWGTSVLPTGTYGLWGDKAGLFLRGYPRIVEYGIVPWGGSPTTVWAGVTRVVPEGTRWYVVVTLIEGAVAENVGWTNRDWSLMFYYRVFGRFDSPEHGIIEQPLTPGTYTNLYLRIFHQIEIAAWDGMNLISRSQEPAALWQVWEVEAQ